MENASGQHLEAQGSQMSENRYSVKHAEKKKTVREKKTKTLVENKSYKKKNFENDSLRT